MKLKKVLSIAAAAVMAVTALTVSMSVSAAATEVTGTCGAGNTWLINSDGVLLISGTNKINGTGWKTYAADIEKIVIESGLTKTALSGAFNTCENLREIYFPDTTESLNSCLSSSLKDIKDIWIFTKELPADFGTSYGMYPETGSGTRWHVYKGSTTETSLRKSYNNGGLALVDSDFEYITSEDKFPGITNRTPVAVPEETATSGPCGLQSTYSWNEAAKTLTFKGKGAVSIKAGFQKFGEKAETVLMDDSEIKFICDEAFGPDYWSSNPATFPKLKKVTFPKTLKKIGDNAFHKTVLENKDLEFAEGMERIGAFAFSNTKISGSLVLPSTMKSLGQEAFGYTNITSVKIPGDMSVGGTVFVDCDNLTEVTIPKGLTYGKNGEGNMSRANKMFLRCDNIGKVIMEDGSTFADEMFSGCNNVAEVVIKSKTFGKIITGANTPFPTNESGVNNNFMDQITFKTYKGSETEKNLLAIGILPEKIEYLTDFVALEKAIKKAEAIETDKYTDASVNSLAKAIADAKALLENENATQEEVNAAVGAINKATMELTVKSTDPTNDKKDPTKKTDPTTSPTTAKQVPKTSATRNASVVAAEKKSASKAMKQAKLTSLKAKSKAKKKINVSWKKVKKAVGYEVQVSAKKNFKKVIFKKDLKKTKLTVKNKNIKSKKTYFVRVRAYATYKDANNKVVKVYSKWNKQIRKVKVK